MSQCTTFYDLSVQGSIKIIKIHESNRAIFYVQGVIKTCDNIEEWIIDKRRQMEYDDEE